MTKQELEIRKADVRKQTQPLIEKLKKGVDELHRKYSRYAYFDAYKTASLLTANHYIWRGNWQSNIDGLASLIQYDNESPYLAFNEDAGKWLERVMNEVPNAMFGEVTPSDCVRVFKKYIPDAPDDLPLFKYFACKPKQPVNKQQPKLKIGDIKPLFSKVAGFVYDNTTDHTTSEKTAFFGLLKRPDGDLLGEYIWQQIPNELKKEDEPQSRITERKMVKACSGGAGDWWKLFGDFIQCVYNATIKGEILAFKDMCERIEKLDASKPSNKKESTLFKALPPQLKSKQ